jgi:hypothetical protein
MRVSVLARLRLSPDGLPGLNQDPSWVRWRATMVRDDSLGLLRGSLLVVAPQPQALNPPYEGVRIGWQDC